MEALLEAVPAQPRAATPPPKAARLAVAALFFANGLLFGTWVSRIPAVQTKLGLSHGVLGMALLAMALGAVIAMPLAGRWSARLGSHTVSVGLALWYAAVLPLLAFAPSLSWLVAGLFCFGVGHGAFDVSMNAQALLVERRYGRSLMSSFHALFSVGGLAGATFGGLAAGQGLTTLTHFGGVSLGLVALLGLISFRQLLDDRAISSTAGSISHFHKPSRQLLVVGLIAFCAMVGEGAMADWSAVFLRDIRHASEAMAAAGYAAFSITMAATRFSGDWLSERFGPMLTVRLSGSLAFTGMAVALLGRDAAWTMAGFALVGAGFAIVVPMAFAAAGRTPGIPSSVALASVTTIGYLGFLIGPPLIGLVSELVGLRGALALLLVSSFTIVSLAPAVGRGTPDLQSP